MIRLPLRDFSAPPPDCEKVCGHVNDENPAAGLGRFRDLDLLRIVRSCGSFMDQSS
jgi:hypothetical protein